MDEINKKAIELSLSLSNKIDAGILEEIASLFRCGVLRLIATTPKHQFDKDASLLTLGQCFRIDFAGKDKIISLEGEVKQLKEENARLAERIEEMEYYIPKIGKDSQDARGEIKQLREEIRKKDELLEAVLINLKAFSINAPNIHSFLVAAIGSILGADKEKS